MEKQMNIPQLRFPEFKEGKNNFYKKHFFKDIFLFSTGKNIKQNEASPEFETPCVRYGELYHMYNEVISEVINKTNLEKAELLFSDGDEILLPSAGEDPLDIGSASALTIKDVAIGRTINILKPAEENIYSQIYVAYYINHKLKKHISTLAKGVSISNVYNSDLKTLEIMLPTLPEQTKIANFFTAIDTKLQALKTKKEKMQVYKKGVMQKIFSQSLRFKNKNGKAFADWEVKKLGDLDLYISDGNYGELYPKASEMKNIGVPFIRANNIKNLSLVWNDMKFIEEEHHKILTSGHLLENDILVTTRGDIGMVAYVTGEFEGANINAQICLLRTKSDVNSKYLIQYLGSEYGYKQFKSLQTGSALKQLPKGNLVKLNIPTPSLYEQTAIANFLSATDEKINKTNNQITQMEQWKKGLLQKMFV
jgi:type I restriction enzyme, S subunit